MNKLTKFHVLMYLAENEVNNIEELLELVRRNIKFENLGKRGLYEKLRSLRKEGLIKNFRLNKNNKKLYNILGFLYWARFRGKNWEALLEKNSIKIFNEIMKKYKTDLQTLVKLTKLSQPTVSKYLNILEENKFIDKIKLKPLVVKPLVNDTSLFYINLLKISLRGFGKKFKQLDIKGTDSQFKEKIAEMHSYSTTVTEGNTATSEEVHRVLGNFSTRLTPREIKEIQNSYRAVEKLYEIREKDITIEKIKELHTLLMDELIENLGEFQYGRKRIIGSSFKPPKSSLEINNSLKALENFINKNLNNLSSEVLGAMAHFLFASIHPFEDGNGGMARLLHSWILLKENKPPFIYDPNLRDQYRRELEKGNQKSIESFISFCIEKHRQTLEKI